MLEATGVLGWFGIILELREHRISEEENMNLPWTESESLMNEVSPEDY